MNYLKFKKKSVLNIFIIKLMFLIYFFSNINSEFERRAENKASKFLLSSTSTSRINDCIRVAESFVDFAFRKHHQVVVSGRIQRNVNHKTKIFILFLTQFPRFSLSHLFFFYCHQFPPKKPKILYFNNCICRNFK